MKNIDELAKRFGLKVYDTAIPVEWSDKVTTMTGRTYLEILKAGFVWSYDRNGIFGEPFPLTDAAWEIMDEIKAKPSKFA